MDGHRERFIQLTPKSEDERNWKERLLRPQIGSALRLDLCYLGGQTVSDIIVGHVSETSIDPQVVEAYHLQYPDLSQHISFVDEVRRLAGDPDRLRGFVSGIKGKEFELAYCDYLNDGHLPIGYTAGLSPVSNTPGTDITIRDSHDHIHQRLQAKAWDSLQGVKEHLERYPEVVPVIIPGDQVALANTEGLGHYVEGAPVTEQDLEQTVNHAVDQAEIGAGIHLPLVGFALLTGEVVFLLWRGKLVSFKQVLKRGAKMTVAAVVGQTAYLLSHSFWVGVPVTITARALMERYSDSKDFVDLLRDKKKWARAWTDNVRLLTL